MGRRGGVAIRPQDGDWPSERRVAAHQSTYFAGLVSGRSAQIKAAPAAVAAAIDKNPARSPNCWTTKPTEPVLTAAAVPVIVPRTPRAKLKRPVPVVRSVT